MEEQLRTPAVIQQEKNRIREWLKKLLPNGYDKIDVEAIFDSSLSYSENKEQFRDKVKILLNNLNDNLKEQAEDAHNQQDKLDAEVIKVAEEEVDSYNKGIDTETSMALEAFYRPLTRAVEKVAQGYSNLSFIKGRGGIGKSFNIRKKLLKHAGPEAYVEVCGEVTEAYLYRLIFENNGKILWFKDVVKLLSGLGSLNLLKSATETEDKRILTKSSYSKQQDDLPNKFICKCKFIFDYNNLFGLGLRDDFEALISRGDFIELPISNDDIKRIMMTIAKEEWQKEVTAYIIKNFEATGLIRLNLRTQWKAFKTHEYSEKNKLQWRTELKQELKNNSKIRSLLYSLIGDRVITTKELKKLLLSHEIVNTLRTADRKVNEWLFLDEIYRWTPQDRNFKISINPKPEKPNNYGG